jgi:RecA-family ATPase
LHHTIRRTRAAAALPSVIGGPGVDFMGGEVTKLKVTDLRGKLCIVPAIPLLQDPQEVHSFVEAQREFSPDVIVLDTLATATAGLDENSSMFAAMLTDNGAVGYIKREFKATVIVVAHEGKGSSKGARGHSGLSGNVDAGLSDIASAWKSGKRLSSTPTPSNGARRSIHLR